jgi:hypothetical protein
MTETDGRSEWLAVIGKSLAFLCLSKAIESHPGKYDTVLKKVKFLEGLGLTRGDAAQAAGSSADSVAVMHRRKKAGGAKNGRKKKKSTRR